MKKVFLQLLKVSMQNYIMVIDLAISSFHNHANQDNFQYHSVRKNHKEFSVCGFSINILIVWNYSQSWKYFIYTARRKWRVP